MAIVNRGKLIAIGTRSELREAVARQPDAPQDCGDLTLEDIFFHLTGGAEYAERIQYLNAPDDDRSSQNATSNA